MKMCQEHWDMLRKEIKDQGLDEWVAPDGTTAVLQLVDQVKKEADTPVNYDPLMSCWFMIMNRILEVYGIFALSPEFGCPVCRVQSERNEDGSCACGRDDCGAKEPGTIPDPLTWLSGPDSCVTASKQYMKEMGWIDGQNKET